MPTHQQTERSAFVESLLSLKDDVEASSKLTQVCNEVKSAGVSCFGSPLEQSLSENIREKSRDVDVYLDTVLADVNFMQDNSAVIAKCKTLICQGHSETEFDQLMSKYDSSVKCGAVWEWNAVAFRCTTCSVNPCMSLCMNCFNQGNHEGHDFSRFFSQAGGACDCGDLNIIRPDGCCVKHGPSASLKRPSVPENIISVAEFMVPKLFVRLMLRFRHEYRFFYSADFVGKEFADNFQDQTNNFPFVTSNRELRGPDLGLAISNSCSGYIELIQILINKGGPLRTSIADCLLNCDLYEWLLKEKQNEEAGRSIFLDSISQIGLDEAISKLQSIKLDGLDDDDWYAPVSRPVNLMQELVFWMCRLYFPQSLVTMILGLYPIGHYQEPFALCFFQLYPKIAALQVETAELYENIPSEGMSSRVIHISVQILSNEALCVQLEKRISLLSNLIHSSEAIMASNLTPFLLIQDESYQMEERRHIVPSPYMTADCSKVVMQKRVYATAVSDLNCVLGHKPLAQALIANGHLLDSYCRFIGRMQGMNLNWRVVRGDHVAYEERSYKGAFMAEWESAGMSIWLLLNAVDAEHHLLVHLLIEALVKHLKRWLQLIGLVRDEKRTSPLWLTFHLPLHRHLAAALCHAIQNEIPFDKSAPFWNELFLRRLTLHPMRIQAGKAEMAANMWVRNGPTALFQALLYAQSHLCTSFHDLDLALLQIIAANVHPEWFMTAVIESFYLAPALGFQSKLKTIELRDDWAVSMIDAALRLMTEILTVRTNIGLSREEVVDEEVVASLCISDKTYSEVKTALPEKGANLYRDNDILLDKALQKFGVFMEADSMNSMGRETGSTLRQGIYSPKTYVWKDLFDPVLCRMRAPMLKDYGLAVQRFHQFVKSEKLLAMAGGGSKEEPWLPYRLRMRPARGLCTCLFALLYSPSFISLIQIILDKHMEMNIMESTVQMAVYLLTLAVKFYPSNQDGRQFLPVEGTYSELTRPWTDMAARCNLDQLFLTPKSTEKDDCLIELIVKLGLSREKLTVLREYARMDVLSAGDIGCAGFFIGRLIALLYQSGGSCAKRIEQLLGMGISEQAETEKEENMDTTVRVASPILSDRGRKRQEMREGIMRKFGEKQKQIMKRLMEQEGVSQSDLDAMDTSEETRTALYDCVICGDRTPSTVQAAIGLIVRVQASGVYGRSVSSEETKVDILMEEEDRKEVMTRRDWLKASASHQRQHLEGVEVKTCAHYVHSDCLRTYIVTLRDDHMIRETVRVSKMEYPCPMCRRLMNALLPVPKSTGSEKLKVHSDDVSSMLVNVTEAIQNWASADSDCEATNTGQPSLYVQCITNFLGQCHRWYRPSLTTGPHLTGLASPFAILKTNLVLLSMNQESAESDPQMKRFLPIESLVMACCSTTNFHVDQKWVANDWASLVERTYEGPALLLRDLTDSFIRMSSLIICSQSLTNSDKLNHLTLVYQMMLLARIVQTLLHWLTGIGPSARCIEEWRCRANELKQIQSFQQQQLEIKDVFDRAIRHTVVDNLMGLTDNEIKSTFVLLARKNCLELGRVAIILWSECGLKPIDYALIDCTSFDSINSHLTAGKCLEMEVGLSLIDSWLDELQSKETAQQCQGLKKEMDRQVLEWTGGRLVELPSSFELLFAKMFSRQCRQCGQCPPDPCLCLCCGTLLCHRSDCCSVLVNSLLPQSELEAHGVTCTDGYCVFLSMLTGLILITDNRQAAVWGSVYLDAHGEEDRYLKRGKPLTLSLRRYGLLQRQWRFECFDNANLRWLHFQYLSQLMAEHSDLL